MEKPMAWAGLFISWAIPATMVPSEASFSCLMMWAWVSRRASSAFFLSVMSLIMAMASLASPSFISLREISTGKVVPSFRRPRSSYGLLVTLIMLFFRQSIDVNGLPSSGSPSFSITLTSWHMFMPSTSSWLYPNSLDAAGLNDVILPFSSMVMSPSSMLSMMALVLASASSRSRMDCVIQ